MGKKIFLLSLKDRGKYFSVNKTLVSFPQRGHGGISRQHEGKANTLHASTQPAAQQLRPAFCKSNQ